MIHLSSIFQQANKKEKNYQEQIESLTKTNHILYYSLAKEKEERCDLDEMYQIMEMEHKKFKSENMFALRDAKVKLEEVSVSHEKMSNEKATLEKKSDDLQVRIY